MRCLDFYGRPQYYSRRTPRKACPSAESFPCRRFRCECSLWRSLGVSVADIGFRGRVARLRTTKVFHSSNAVPWFVRHVGASRRSALWLSINYQFVIIAVSGSWCLIHRAASWSPVRESTGGQGPRLDDPLVSPRSLLRSVLPLFTSAHIICRLK